MSDLARRLVLAACRQHNDLSDRTVALDAGDAAPLFEGADSEGAAPLDSIALIGLLVAIETAVEDDLGLRIFLVDAGAAARARSPFATVGALVAYVDERIARAAADQAADAGAA